VSIPPYRRLYSLSLLAIYIGCNGWNLGQSIWDKMWCYLLWEQFEDHMGTPRTGRVSLNFVRAHSKNMMQTSKSPKNKIKFKNPILPFSPKENL